MAADFEAEWAALPAGEGVTLEGEPFPGENPSPERLERAQAFMRRLRDGPPLPRFRHRKGGVYVVTGRRVVFANLRAGELVFRHQDDLIAYEVTDPVALGEEAVFYEGASGDRWCRPASMFDDGRFTPL